jgi:hypothetical protein
MRLCVFAPWREEWTRGKQEVSKLQDVVGGFESLVSVGAADAAAGFGSATGL